MGTVFTEELFKKQPLRISRFCHYFTKDGVTAWYHSLRLKPIFIGSTLSNLLKTYENGQTTEMYLKRLPEDQRENGEKIVSKLYTEKMLISVQDNEFSELLQLQQEFLYEPAIGVLYLLLNDCCNFRCTYCFIENALPSEYHFSTMDVITARKSLDLYSRVSSKGIGRKTIIFYGGEPLINVEVLQFCLEYIYELKGKGLLPDNLATTINTNGSLVTEEVVDLFRRYDVAVSVSLDGPREIHNQCRRTIDNQGTFEWAIRGYQLLKGGNVNVGISCTVGDHNIEQLPQIVEWFISDLGINFLGLNPLTDLPGKQLSSESYIKRFTEATIKCFIIARKWGLYEDRMMRKVEAFVEHKVYPFDCAGCGRQLVITPDGKVGVCHAYLGTLKNFLETELTQFHPSQEIIWQEWCRRSPLGMPQCFGCPALGICGGGCPYNAHLNFGSIWSRDYYFCIYTQRILEWLIWDVYEQMQKRKTTT